MTLTREGLFVGSEDDNVEEINIFDGQDNRITFEQVGDVDNDFGDDDDDGDNNNDGDCPERGRQ